MSDDFLATEESLMRRRGAQHRIVDYDPPGWAVWRGSTQSAFTIGIEEELMLLDERDWSLAYCSEEVLAKLPDELRERVSLETHAAVIELTTRPHERVDRAIWELAGLRRRLSAALAELGLRAAGAGTHPSAVWNDSVVTPQPRYQAIEESTRVLARREPTLAMHVHVGIPDPNDAIRALNRMRVHLPLLLALSANSPFWQGRPTGLAATRPSLFGAFPRSGLPRRFRDYRDWADSIESLMTAEAIPDSSYLWWDLRPQPRLGTLEVRIMDAQTSVEDVGALAALVQALVRMEVYDAPAGPWRTNSEELIEENRFLAARDGMDAMLIDPSSGGRIPAVGALEQLLAACRPHAWLLDCERELDSTRALAAENGAAMQLRLACDGDLDQLAASLAERFSPSAQLTYPLRRRKLLSTLT
jgi:glutamate---cysteine ligase / carboxylate-amine ligase